MTKITARIKYSKKVIYPILKYLFAALIKDQEKCVKIIDEMVDKNLILFTENENYKEK